MSAATPAPDRLPILDIEDPWLDEDPGPPPPLLAEEPGLPSSWLAAEPEPTPPPWLADDPWLAEDPEWADPGPAAPEVLKAGRWDRTHGDGAGFAAGGVVDHLPPGLVLAGLAGDVWSAGLLRLSDDELIGLVRAARRLTSWATAMELAAAGDLWRRRLADERAGDAGAAEHAPDELAAALTLTGRAADHQLGLAVALSRLPLTSAALAAGDIDLPRAQVIADELTGLDDTDAAVVEAAVAGAAPGQTTGQLRNSTRRRVQAVDPDAARKRKEAAQREARVERWAEHAGTAALAGRDLPPAEVLAADTNLSALAKQLKTAGVPGTMDTLRAKIYLALLTGAPVSSLLPAASDGAASDGAAPEGAAPEGAAPEGAVGSPGSSGSPGSHGDLGAFGVPGAVGAVGRVNLTLPLATWLGQSETPGDVAGFGPLDAADSRALADAMAAKAGTRWCLTLTGPDGRPVAHGCTRAGRAAGRRGAAAGVGPRAGPAADCRDGPGPGTHDPPGAGSRDGPTAAAADRPAAADGPVAAAEEPAAGTAGGPRMRWAGPAGGLWIGTVDGPWTFTITSLTGGDCDHAWETPAYRPPRALRHLVEMRHNTCVFPGCRRPAAQCDADHTIAYEIGGRTCLCNLAPLCRRHHQAKQTPGWSLEQSSPGTLTWTTPSGRRYTVTPAGPLL